MALKSGDDGAGIPDLPEELLSIIVDADVLNFPETIEAENSRRHSLEGYLMAWSLIFKYFHNTVLGFFEDFLFLVLQGPVEIP